MLTPKPFRFVGDLANLLGATLARLVPTVIVRGLLLCLYLRNEFQSRITRSGGDTFVSLSIALPDFALNLHLYWKADSELCGRL